MSDELTPEPKPKPPLSMKHAAVIKRAQRAGGKVDYTTPPRTRTGVKRLPFTKGKTHQKLTKAEHLMVENFIKTSPTITTEEQMEALGVLLNRRKEAIKTLITRAREKFHNAAEDYVDIHLQATKKALRMRDYDSALKGATWGIQNISYEGMRVVEKEAAGPSGVQVLVGVKLGGLTDEPAK